MFVARLSAVQVRIVVVRVSAFIPVARLFFADFAVGAAMPGMLDAFIESIGPLG